MTDTNEPVNRSMPPGIIIPELMYNDLDAATAWLRDVLGFQERLRIGSHRCQMVYRGAGIVAVAGNSRSVTAQPEMAHSLMVRVENVNQHYQNALLHGARVIQPPADYPYGERQYTLEDIGGHRWTFTQSIADVAPAKWGGRLADEI